VVGDLGASFVTRSPSGAGSWLDGSGGLATVAFFLGFYKLGAHDIVPRREEAMSPETSASAAAKAAATKSLSERIQAVPDKLVAAHLELRQYCDENNAAIPDEAKVAIFNVCQLLQSAISDVIEAARLIRGPLGQTRPQDEASARLGSDRRRGPPDRRGTNGH